jgi:hypothetical protein
MLIATGSNNTARYFHYFKDKPAIIRKAGNFIAILMKRNQRAIDRLRRYICYFGLGCRNVSKIFVPKGYSFPLKRSIYQDIIHYEKYANNYNKAILMSNFKLLDNGF